MSGINLFLASTGQEEIQYKVLTQFGLSDIDIRSWFNGPAFLTWSRISNEYGNDIAGPLPRSWMKSQHALQLKIVKRYRSLGMSGQLPGFQGNVPIQFKAVHADTNITQQGDTGWMDSLDPFYAKIADIWMKTMLADFGTDHWYQLDGYFNGGTAPWLAAAGAADRATLARCGQLQRTPGRCVPVTPGAAASRAQRSRTVGGCFVPVPRCSIQRRASNPT